MTKAEAKTHAQNLCEYYGKALGTAWNRNEAVTVMYLELANIEAKKLAEYFNSE